MPIDPWVPVAAGVAGAAVAALAFLSRLRERHERHTDEARRMSAWAVEVAPLRTEDDRGRHISPIAGASSVLVRVSNRNDVGIEGSAIVRQHYGPDSGSLIGFEQVFPPGETDVWVDGVELPEGGLAGMPYVDLAFRDSRGRRWVVRHGSRLSPDRCTPEGLEQSRLWHLRRRLIRIRQRLRAT